MRFMLKTSLGVAAIAAMIVAVGLPSVYSVERPTPYASALSAEAPGHDGALPRSCKETRCSQQSDGTYICIKVNSAPWACKVGQGKTTCTEDPC